MNCKFPTFVPAWIATLVLSSLGATLAPRVALSAIFVPWVPLAPCLGGVQVSLDAINLFIARDLKKAPTHRLKSSIATSLPVDGQVTVSLVPHHDMAILEICALGRMKLFPYAGGSTIPDSIWTGQMPFVARKQIHITSGRITLQRATSQDSPGKSGKVAGDHRPRVTSFMQQTNQLAADAVSRQARRQLDRQVDICLHDATDHWMHQPWLPTQALEAFLPNARLSTSDTHASMNVPATADGGMPPPRRFRGFDPRSDFQVLCQEAMMESLAEHCLGGEPIQDVEVMRHVVRMRGSAPWELWVHARRPRWAMTLAARRPIAFCFDENQIRIAIHGVELQYGEDLLRAPFEVGVTYSPSQRDAPHLVRVSDPTITLGASSMPPHMVQRYEALLKQKFGAIFPSEIFFDGLQPPVGGSWDKFRKFQLAHWVVDNGWFDIGFQLQQNTLR